MIATSGAALLKPSAVRALTKELLPKATLVTPNVPEAEALTESRIREPEDLRRAARILHERFGCAVLAKGGHLNTRREAIDVFYDGKTELLLTTARVRAIKTHGTGCTFSAAIAGYLALGQNLEAVVQSAKNFVASAIRGSVSAAGHDVLDFGAK